MRQPYIIFGLLIMSASLGFLVINQEVLAPNRKARVMITRGKFYLEQGNVESWKKSIEEFTRAASLFPGSSHGKEALFYLGEAYEKMGMFDIAAEKYRQLAKDDLSENLRRKVRFKTAKLQIVRSYTEEGISALMVLLAQTNDREMRSEIYTELGTFHLKHGRNEKAKRNFEIALQEDPQNRAARLALARSLSALGKNEAAYSVYENYLSYLGEIDPHKELVVDQYRSDIFRRGLNYFEEKKFIEANNYFELLAKRFPGTNEAEESAYYAGVAFFQQANYAKAVELFNRVISQEPKTLDESAYIKKGESLFMLKEYSRAAAVFAEYRRIYGDSKFTTVAAEWEEEIKKAINETSGAEESRKAVEKVEKEDEEAEEPFISGAEKKAGNLEEIQEPRIDDEENVTP